MTTQETKTLPCNKCGKPILIPEEHAWVESAEHGTCPTEEEKDGAHRLA